MSYVFSFDNLVVSSFLTTPQVNTLPVYLYGSLQYGPSPAVYAAAVAVFVFTMVLLGIAGLLYRAGAARGAAPSTRVPCMPARSIRCSIRPPFPPTAMRRSPTG